MATTNTFSLLPAGMMTEDRAANLSQVVVVINASGCGTCRRGSKSQSWKATLAVSAPLHSRQTVRQLPVQAGMVLFDCGIYRRGGQFMCSREILQKGLSIQSRSLAMARGLPVEAKMDVCGFGTCNYHNAGNKRKIDGD